MAYILVVDDNIATGKHSVDALDAAGHEATLVREDYWQDAANKVTNHLRKRIWDIVVFDILFPGDQFGGIWLYNDLVRRGLHRRWNHTIIYTKYVGPHVEHATDGEELIVRVFIQTAQIPTECVLSNVTGGRKPLIDKVATLLKKGTILCPECARPC